MKVFVLHIDHEYGVTTSAFSTFDKALADLAFYVRTYWDQTGLSEQPTSDQDVVDAYFEEMQDQSYSIDSVIVDEPRTS